VRQRGCFGDCSMPYPRAEAMTKPPVNASSGRRSASNQPQKS